MGEGMEDPSKMTRRGFMAGTVATLAAAAVPEAAVAADSPDKTKAGQEGPEHMLHAFREYQRHDTNGLLEKNFSDYQKNVKDESNAIHLKKKDADLGKFKVGRMALEAQRDGYLAEFDKILIPKLLALYIQNDLQDKSLVRSYKSLFTNPDEWIQARDKIKKEGELGIDKARIVKIHSKLVYSSDTNSAEAKRSPLSFFAEK